ncbi:MAG: hypothetical protein KBT33_01710 [Prevotellaceae bacterium]|nr:hypothetical protein [Candidatus Minthosoma equi]
MRWFEPNLQKVLLEAGKEGLRINNIVRNVCNMEPSLFGVLHPYDEAYGEIYRFLRAEVRKARSPYQYAVDKNTGKQKWGVFCFDKTKMPQTPPTFNF